MKLNCNGKAGNGWQTQSGTRGKSEIVASIRSHFRASGIFSNLSEPDSAPDQIPTEVHANS